MEGLLILLVLTSPAAAPAEKPPPPDLRRLIQDLKSDDPQTLDEALAGLTRLGPKAAGAVDALAAMLTDARRITYPTARYRTLRRTFQVNVSAVGALRSIGKPAVPALVSALGNADSLVRQRAAGALTEIRQPVEARHWIRALGDSNRYVRIIAARQLGSAKGRSAVEALCKALADDHMDVRVEVADALGRAGDARAVGPLIAALSDATVNARHAAGRALAQIGRPALEALLARFETLDQRARGAGATAIQSADPKRVGKLLAACLASTHWQVREGALYALIKHKTPEAPAAARRMLKDPRWHVRWTAARGVGELADEKTAGAARAVLLGVLADDAEPKVRAQALWALYYLPDRPTEAYWRGLQAALGDESPTVREAAATSAAKFWNARLAPALVELLKDPAPAVRAEAALALGGRGVDGVAADLIRLLDDENARCAKYAAISLGKEAADEAVAALAAKVHDAAADPPRRLDALYGLCQTSNPKAVTALRAALADKTLRRRHADVRKALARLTSD